MGSHHISPLLASLFEPPVNLFSRICCQYHYSTLANWTVASSFPMLGTLFVPYFLFGRLYGNRLIRTETPIDALMRQVGIEPTTKKFILYTSSPVEALPTELLSHFISVLYHIFFNLSSVFLFFRGFIVYTPITYHVICFA